MINPSLIAVGEPFPQPLADGAAYWSPEDNLIVICDQGLANEDPAALTIDRIWVTFDGPLIVLTLATASYGAEVAGAWLEGHQRPAWIDTNSADRLLLTAVWVEDNDKRVVRIHTFTLSPHLSSTIRKRAAQEWANPITKQEMLNAVSRWKVTFPDQRSVKAAAAATSRPGAE